MKESRYPDDAITRDRLTIMNRMIESWIVGDDITKDKEKIIEERKEFGLSQMCNELYNISKNKNHDIFGNDFHEAWCVRSLRLAQILRSPKSEHELSLAEIIRNVEYSFDIARHDRAKRLFDDAVNEARDRVSGEGISERDMKIIVEASGTITKIGERLKQEASKEVPTSSNLTRKEIVGQFIDAITKSMKREDAEDVLLKSCHLLSITGEDIEAYIERQKKEAGL